MNSWIKDLPIAHRGLHDESKGIPENSLLSFKEAINHGYAIELDIRLTLDQKVIVFHDANLERMTGHDLDVNETTYEEIKKLTLNNTKEKIPTLAEVLDIVQGEVPLLIELKVFHFDGIIEKESHKLLLNYNGKIAVQSFNPWSIKWFRENAPTIKRGLLAGRLNNVQINIFKKIALRGLFFIPIVKADFIALDYEYYSPSLAKRVAALYKVQDVIFWTIKNKDKAHRLRSSFGLNYIFEDFLPLG